MQFWAVLSVGAFVMWGLWGFFAKIAGDHIDAKSAAVMQGLGGVAVTFVLLASQRFRPELHLGGVSAGIMGGVALWLGIIAFSAALANGGRASVVVPMTALYPIVTIALSVVVLRETVSPTQGMGILMALASIWLMSK
jgi:bacterial/archaeal transporter family protein